MGDHPAATSVRRVSLQVPSSSTGVPTADHRDNKGNPPHRHSRAPRPPPVPVETQPEIHSDWNSSQDATTTSNTTPTSPRRQDPPEELVGAIIERGAAGSRRSSTEHHPPPTTTGTAGTTRFRRATPSSSRFARNQQSHPQQFAGLLTPAPPATGFPTLDVPLGTYVHQNKNSSRSSSSGKPTRPTTSAPSSSTTTTQTTEGASSATPSAASSSWQALREASTRDADALLAQMSHSEMRDSVQELRSVLSPKALAFLQRRGQQQQQQPQQQLQQQKPKTANPEAVLTSSSSPSQTPLAMELQEDVVVVVQGRTNHRERNGTAQDLRELGEKERLAQVLTSIRTVEDLDTAYAAELQQSHPIDHHREEFQPSSNLNEDGCATDANCDDFKLACALLRSTARRQTLWAAKVVTTKLREDVEAGRHCSLSSESSHQDRSTTTTRSWPYPPLLPVSLRCLLDAPASSNGYVLHTYVLQSLHCLLQLRACTDHVVDLSQQESDNSIYQLYVMDDAIPTPRLAACYSSGTSSTAPIPIGDQGNTPVSVYSTSSQSASSDAAAFAADPMWTLLSNMRILPRLANLLNSSTSTPLLPQEGVIAIFGILAMLCQRSAGAATAMAHHATLLNHVALRSTIVVSNSPQEDCDGLLDNSAAVAALVLLCTLARQSREAAQAIDLEAFLYRVLAPASDGHSSPDGVRLQQWALVLWRTLLRYGLAVELTPSVLTMSVSHYTLGPKVDSLAPEVFTALAQVARCLGVAARQSRTSSGGINDPIPRAMQECLAGAEEWVSSVLAQARRHVSVHIDDSTAPTALERLRFYGSCLSFLDGAITLSTNDDDDNGASIYSRAFLSDTDVESDAASLISLVESESIRQAMAACWGAAGRGLDDTKLQTASAFFIESLTTLIYKLRRLFSSESSNFSASTVSALQLLFEKCRKALLGGIAASFTTSKMLSSHKDSVAKPIRGSQNRVLVATCRFLASTDSHFSSEETRVLTMFAIGRLQFGEESQAAKLGSLDSVFLDRLSEPDTDAPISSMLVGELCRSPTARCQLDHSFKLFGGTGITDTGLGPFDLQSLRSEANQPAPGIKASDFLLPVGPLWMYQILSGVSPTEQADNAAQQENSEHLRDVTKIFSSCLRMIQKLEASNNDFTCAYIQSLEVGGKLYHLTNVCLQPEAVFCDSDIQQRLESLVDMFATNPKDWLDSFVTACAVHSSTKTPHTVDGGRATAEEEKLHQLLQRGEEPTNGGRSQVILRDLEDFVGDLCDAYIEYGAQYRSFTKCMRLFLLPCFPPKIRCEVLLKLRGAVHMLHLDDDTLDRMLPRYLHLDAKDLKDAAEVLDAVCSIYSKSSGSRLDSGWVVSWSVAVVARCLSHSLTVDRNLAPYRRRLSQLHETFCARVLHVTRSFLSSGDGSLSSLVRATLMANVDEISHVGLPSASTTFQDPSNDWDALWASLLSSKAAA